LLKLLRLQAALLSNLQYIGKQELL